MPTTPITALDPNAKWHPDTDTAATEAFKTLPRKNGIPLDHEYAGVLYADGKGQHSYSTPISQQDHDGFALQAQVQKGHKLSGIYHNHPGTDADGQYFSENDIQVADRLGVPSYIYFEKDGSVRKYVPRQTKTTTIDKLGSRFPRRVAVGDPVNPTAPQSPSSTVGTKDAVPGPDAAVSPPPTAGLLSRAVSQADPNQLSSAAVRAS